MITPVVYIVTPCCVKIVVLTCFTMCYSLGLCRGRGCVVITSVFVCLCVSIMNTSTDLDQTE